MKINKLAMHMLKINKEYILLLSILLASLVYRVILFKLVHPNWIIYNSDSVSYFANIDIFNGIIDLYRTPIYPYLIKFFNSTFATQGINKLIAFQQILSFLSIIPFYFISIKLIKNRYAVSIITLFYGCIHWVVKQNVNINPEALAIIASVCILFITLKYLEKPSPFLAAIIGISPFILIMLKPTYLILLVLVFVFFASRFILIKKERFTLFVGLIACGFSIIGIYSYCKLNEKYNGEFTLTKISLNNSIANIVISNAYVHGNDKEFIDIIDTYKSESYYKPVFLLNNNIIDTYKNASTYFPSYLEPTSDMVFCLSIPKTKDYPIDRVSEFVKKSQHSSTYLKYIFARFWEIFVRYLYLMVIILLELILIVYCILKNNKVAWLLLFSISFIAGQFATIAIGGIYDWNRLLVPSYPFIILIIGVFVNLIISYFRKQQLVDQII